MNLFENLYAIVSRVCDDDAPAEVDRNVPWRLELTVSASSASNSAQAGAVAKAQHLNAVVFGVRNNNIPAAVESDCKRAAEVAVAAAFRTKSTQTRTICGAEDLHTMIACRALNHCIPVEWRRTRNLCRQR